MQITVPPLTFLFSALHYMLYNATIDGGYEISPYMVRNKISPVGVTHVYADTKVGRVQGIQQRGRQGQKYAWFRGIPYAKPPVGELRYEPPVPHEGWAKDGVLDATFFKPQCPQVNLFNLGVVGREDCLFLNIATRRTFSHGERPHGYTQLKPVLFFIHGGLFMFGGANPFGPKYWMDEDVVFVSINYRLNSFGFLNTGDGVVQGNMGLKDQTLALRWVRDNIKYFGGDPKRVTLIGESAGAVCAHLHTLSPHSAGLFAGAISLSGTALSPWAHVQEPVKQSREYGQGLNCPTHNTKAMVRCLKGLDAETVAKYHLRFVHHASEGEVSLFGPTVDSGGPSPSKFLLAKPLHLLRTRKISKTPWIGGVNSGDGLVYLIPIVRNDTMRKLVSDKWDVYAPALLGYMGHKRSNVLTQAVSSYYLHNEKGISHRHLNDTGNMFSDRGFFLDNHDVAVMQSRVAPTYVYYYTYEGVFSMGNLLFDRTPLPIPHDWNYMLGGGMKWLSSILFNRRLQRRKVEIFHGDEMPLLFNIPLIRREVGRRDPDYEFSRRMISLFVSFAERGFPDPARAGEAGVKWDKVPKKYKREGWRRDAPLKRLNLDKQMRMMEEPFHERMTFWRRHDISYIEEPGIKNNYYPPEPAEISYEFNE